MTQEVRDRGKTTHGQAEVLMGTQGQSWGFLGDKRGHGMGVEEAEVKERNLGGVLGCHTGLMENMPQGTRGRCEGRTTKSGALTRFVGAPPGPASLDPSLTSAYSALPLPFTSANNAPSLPPPATATALRQSAKAWPPRPRCGPALAPGARLAREAGRRRHL